MTSKSILILGGYGNAGLAIARLLAGAGGNPLMRTLAIRLGTWGAALGMLAGAVELSLGAHIRPYIGNKENPFILGVVTLALSGLAWITVRRARQQVPTTADRNLATILGVLVPVSAVQVGLFSAIALANVVMVFFLLRNVIEEGV